jgi:membrane protein
MNNCLIASMIVVVTFAISYGESARKTKSNQEVLALQKGLLKGCLASLGLLLLPIFGSLAFPKVQPNLSAVIFVLELVGIVVFGCVELRKLNYREVKLSCLLALLISILLIWCQLFSYYQMDRDFFGNLKFIMATVPTWLLTFILVVFTYLDGPKLRAKKKSKAEVENAKLREQIERMQNQQNKLQEDNEKLRSVVQGTKSGNTEPKSESVTEDKKAESNLPKNTQAEEESTTKVEEAQTTTSAPKSDAEENPKLEVTNPSMTGVQQQKLSEILNRLAGDPSPEAQQAAIEEIVKNYRSATAKEAPAPEEETSSQEPEVVDFEEESDEEEEEILDPVDDEDWEDGTILTDLLAKINPVTIVLVVAIIFVIYAIARVVF